MKSHSKDRTLVCWICSHLRGGRKARSEHTGNLQDPENAPREIKPADLFALHSILQGTVITNFRCLSSLILAVLSSFPSRPTQMNSDV